MRRWMVNAACPAYSEKTLAARPVGASSTSFCPSVVIAFTMAAASVVLPVPAEPRITMTASGWRSVMNRAKVSMASFCSAVGSSPSASRMRYVSSSVIIFACEITKKCVNLQKILAFCLLFCTFAAVMTNIQKTNLILALVCAVLAVLCVLSILEK